MYEKDKRQRITLRLNEEQFSCVKAQCDSLGISPSDFIRMLVNTYLYSLAHEQNQQEKAQALAQAIKEDVVKTIRSHENL